MPRRQIAAPPPSSCYSFPWRDLRRRVNAGCESLTYSEITPPLFPPLPLRHLRIWVGKFEAGALDEDVQAADLIQEYEAKIGALERMVGRQALEIELLKGALKHAPRPKSAITSVVTGPAPSPFKEGAS